MEKFRALGLSEGVLEALAKKGFETPTEIQEKTIPLLLAGQKDIVGQAQTGTGKTAAFGLPLIEQLDESNRAVQALVLCPTRELAVQVCEEIMSFKGDKKLYAQPIYGGQSYTIQINALKRGVQIVVGTPGRIRDHIEKGTLKLNAVTHVVLDEADEMLNMGFEEEVREILKSVPEQRRMLMFSATMPSQILRLAKTFMKDYDLVEIKKQEAATEMIDQMYFEVRDRDRFEALCRIIDTEPEFYGIVFCRTKAETDDIADKLMDKGYDSEGIHGDVTQSQREIILKKFKMRKINILVATDVAARGIDVNDLTHVINYNLPQDPESYVHRIGRTGRAGKQGTAISIVSPNEMRDLMFIQRLTKSKIRKDEVPSIEDVVQTKTMKVKTEIQAIIEQDKFASYLDLAKELIEENGNAEATLAAVMKYAIKDVLNAGSYREIGASGAGASSYQPATMDGDKTRLFVARGHEDNMNAERVAQFLAEDTNIAIDSIHDIRVFDKFTFITTTNEVADILLAAFSKRGRGGKPLVTRAKEKQTGGFGGGDRDRGDRGGDRGGRSFERRDGGSQKPRGNSYGSRSNDGGGFRKRNDGAPSGDRKRSYDSPAPSGERRDFRKDDRSFEKKPFDPTASSSDSRPRTEGRAPVKRQNKLTDYLDKPTGDTTNPKKSQFINNDKPAFKTNDDDLKW
jgi:ATP-dependent RNA helicase DeaD